jgi:hypothetical protein
VPSWSEHQADLARLATTQLFFVGGAPRSGTTWLQQILNAHPDISCAGEGLFQKHLADPLHGMMAQRRQALETKNTNFFRHTGGYALPTQNDTEFLIGTAVLQAFLRQTGGKPYLAVGEKTPENVFFFPRLKRLFPGAKFIGIARDPRDVLASAWHFFHKPVLGEDETTAKTAFVQSALHAVNEGAHSMLALAEQHPIDCAIITYEALRREPAPIIATLFRLLGVSAQDAVVNACLAQTSFATLTGGRPTGVEERGSFLRKGVVGDWSSTLTPEMNAMILHELGWMFPHFGWQP